MTKFENDEDKIARLKDTPNLNELQQRKVDGMFPVVSPKLHEAAVDGFFAIARKYSISEGDLSCLMKAYGLMFYKDLAALGYSKHPLPPTASESSAVALRKKRQSQNEWNIERLADVRDRIEMPAYEAKVLWYAVSDQEYRISRNAFYSIADQYGIPQCRQQHLRVCITNMLFWMLSTLVTPEGIDRATSDPMIKWQ